MREEGLEAVLEIRQQVEFYQNSKSLLENIAEEAKKVEKKPFYELILDTFEQVFDYVKSAFVSTINTIKSYFSPSKVEESYEQKYETEEEQREIRDESEEQEATREAATDFVLKTSMQNYDERSRFIDLLRIWGPVKAYYELKFQGRLMGINCADADFRAL